MNLDQQIQMLVNEAPQDTQTPKAIESIAPALKHIAERLKYEQYFLLQTYAQSWQVTTLSHRSQPDLKKRVIYAFAHLEDAMGFTQDRQLMALPLPVIPLIFQLLALETIDSLIFLETPGNAQIGVEIQRSELQHLIYQQLQEQRDTEQQNSIPPDIA